MPPGFTFGIALAGTIQCHNDVPCPGTRISAADRSIWMPANEAIEIAYKEAPGNRKHADAIFFGSQFENSDVRLPKGAPNKRFTNLLLSKLRGIRNQRRPDIIDFENRVFYEIKSADDTARGTVQLESYYRLTEEIRRAHADFDEPPWKIEYATWYPPHVLPLPSDPQFKIICTQATDHSRSGWPGLILYDVRQLQRRRRQQRVSEYRLEAFEPAQAEFAPMIRAQLPKTVPFYEPDSPDYVIIVPQDFYTLDYIKQKAAKQWDLVRLKLPFFIDTHQQMVVAKYISWIIIGAAVGAWAGGIAIAAAAGIGAAAGATVVTATTVEASAQAGAIEVVIAYEASGAAAVQSTIVAPGAIAAEVAGGSSAMLQAMFSAPAVKAAAAAAGALLILGNVRQARAASALEDAAATVGSVLTAGNARNAQAEPQNATANAAVPSATARATSPNAAPSLDHIVAIKAIPIDEFQPMGGIQTAFSDRSPTQCFDTSKAKFGLGTKVMYDNNPHWIIGRFSVR